MRLKGSVGRGGANIPGDVLYVQYLLNDWRNENGRQLIALDGVVGPATIAAIVDFQTAQTHFVDALVDTNKASIHALERFQREKLKLIQVDPRSRGILNNFLARGRVPGDMDFAELYLNALHNP